MGLLCAASTRPAAAQESHQMQMRASLSPSLGCSHPPARSPLSHEPEPGDRPNLPVTVFWACRPVGGASRKSTRTWTGPLKPTSACSRVLTRAHAANEALRRWDGAVSQSQGPLCPEGALARIGKARFGPSSSLRRQGPAVVMGV
jgi:hypothetical protein